MVAGLDFRNHFFYLVGGGVVAGYFADDGFDEGVGAGGAAGDEDGEGCCGTGGRCRCDGWCCCRLGC